MLYGVESAVPFVAIVLAITLLYLRVRRRWPAARLFFLSVFVAYLTVVAHYVILPIRTDDDFIGIMRGQPDWFREINLIPFADFPPVGVSQQFLGNIVLGVPFGLGAPFVVGRSGPVIVAIGLAFAVGIESIQFLMNLVYGFTYRFVDINDAILNFAGVLIGLAGFYVLRVLYKVTLGPGTSPSYFDAVLAPPKGS